VSEAVANEKFPVEVETPVAWGEMDAFGHVNNAVYLRYFESARIAYFEKLPALAELAKRDIRPILARATVDYRLPLQYPDRVKILGRISKLGNTSFTMSYRVLSQRHGALAAEGEGVVVLLDYKERTKVSLPAELRAAVEALEKS
jgi:acyl-CoA thioester hydrolase